MSGTLRVSRAGVGIELRRGPFDVELDGRVVGTVERGGRIEASLEPGRHCLRVRAGRYASRPHTFEAESGEVVDFRCHGAMMWPRYVVSLVKPDLGLSLRRE